MTLKREPSDQAPMRLGLGMVCAAALLLSAGFVQAQQPPLTPEELKKREEQKRQ